MEITYLNHAGTSWPKPPPVKLALSKFDDSLPTDWAAQFAEARNTIVGWFGIQDPSRLLLTPSCTSALSIAIADQTWSKDSNVLTSGMEHHALHRPLFKLTEQGVNLEVIPRTENSPFDLDYFESSLKAKEVQMVALCAASNVTGEIYPLKDIVAIAHDHGAMVLVDAAQTAGWRVFDLVKMGVDLFTFAAHKGLQAPWGIGGLYVEKTVCMNSLAASCEVVNANNIAAEVGCSQMPGYCDAGSVNLPAMFAMAAALRWLDQPEQEQRLTRARAQCDRLRSEISRMNTSKGNRLRLTVPGSTAERMPTVSFTIEGITATEYGQRAKDKGLIGSGGIQCAPLAHRTIGTAPDGVFRLSTGPMTTDDEIDRCLRILTELKNES